MTTGIDAIDRLRRPEYTGENRCVPCTVVNLLIALVLAVAIGLSLPWSSAPAVGALVLLASAVAIYLRGYLVPGTPWLTETYFPDWLLRRFDKHPAAAHSSGDGELDVEAVLVDAGALTECEHVDDLCLTPAFRDAWRSRIERLRHEDTSREDLSTILDVDAADLTIEEHGDAFVASTDGNRVGQWESRAALLADVAAANELAGRVRGWPNFAVEQRGGVLTGLRLFIEQCPACDGAVDVDEDVVRSCCRSFDTIAATCADCGARLFEAEVPQGA